MLGDVPAAAMIPIKDRPRAREFYENIIGLKLVRDMPYALQYDSGGTTVVVYETMMDMSAQHTLVSWPVKDIEAEVADLKSKGVKFEEYDMPELKTVNSISADENGKAAWFKDPDGNILSIVEMP